MPETSPWLTPSRALLLFFAYEMASPCRGIASQIVVGVQSDPMGGLVSRASASVIRVARAVASR